MNVAYKHYIMVDGKLKRTNPSCPRCGDGGLLADHGDFWSCGKCGDRYNKKYFSKNDINVQHKR